VSVHHDESGFTLIELLVAMTLMLIVLSATLDAFAGFSRNSRAVNVKNDAQQDVRAFTGQLARELRNAVSSGAPTPAPLENATAPERPGPGPLDDLMFQTVERGALPAGSLNALNVKRVRYCLDNSTPSQEVLRKQTQRWTTATAPTPPSTTNCPSSDPAWTETTTVADRLVNRDQGQSRPVFVYAYTPTTSTNLTDITGIQTSLFVNREPGKTRNTAELTSAVRLRNTNRAPTAAFNATVQNGHVLLNASSSQDPEGESLTFQWSLGGAPIATDSRLDYYPPPSGLASGTYSFNLKVTDPGNVSNAITKVVTVP